MSGRRYPLSYAIGQFWNFQHILSYEPCFYIIGVCKLSVEICVFWWVPFCASPAAPTRLGAIMGEALKGIAAPLRRILKWSGWYGWVT